MKGRPNDHVSVSGPGRWVMNPARACAGHPTENFFPAHGSSKQAQAARAVCRGCPVVDECREYAIAGGPFVLGIWGGTSEQDRDLTRRARRAEQATAHIRQMEGAA